MTDSWFRFNVFISQSTEFGGEFLCLWRESSGFYSYPNSEIAILFTFLSRRPQSEKILQKHLYYETQYFVKGLTAKSSSNRNVNVLINIA